MKVETERAKAIEVTRNEHKTTEPRQLDAPLTDKGITGNDISENGICRHSSNDLSRLR